jgi:DNA-binding NtrC family response regulator
MYQALGSSDFTESENTPQPNFELEDFVGKSLSIQSMFQKLKIVAPTDSTVLIQGETGTGKELVGEAIHHLSSRQKRPFIKVNCSAIPATLIESELFGHEKGAFTGAISQRIGRFEMANNGTLFLDEIGDIPLELQPKLLRVLQEQEFERIGNSHTIRVNVRVIAATNRDLAKMVEEKQFRSDLYYRLNVFPLMLPPLRERGEDILLLAQYFVNRFAQRMNKRIDVTPEEVKEAFLHYSWPGNVRELQNIIERAVILSQRNVLSVSLCELSGSVQSTACNKRRLIEVERDHIMKVLQETNWVIAGPNGAAIRLGMKRTTLYSRMEKLGINRPEFKTDEQQIDRQPFKFPEEIINETIFVIDDDESIREGLKSLLKSAGFNVQTFTSGQDFLQNHQSISHGCLVLDIKLPGLSGLDLQQQLALLGVKTPIIFITGFASIPMTVQAMKAGAVEFLTKPFSDEALLNAVQQAVEKDRQDRINRLQIDSLQSPHQNAVETSVC